MPTLPNDASKGLVTARDASTLRVGELCEAVGVEYRVGSPHLYKLLGRSSLSVALGATVQALVKAQYDSASDVLIAVADGEVFESTASTNPSFTTTTLTGLDDEVQPQFVGFNERWLMCNGVDDNYIREPAPVPGGTDGNWRKVGMQRPTSIPTLSVILGTAAATVRPTSTLGGDTYTNPERAYDTDSTTNSAGTVGKTVTYDFSTNFLAANCNLYIDHSADDAGKGAGTRADRDTSKSGSGTTSGGTTAPTSNVVFNVSYSVDGGTTWLPITASTEFARTTHTKPLTIGLSLGTNLKVRAFSTGTTGFIHKIYDIRVSDGSTGVGYTSAGDTVYYGYSEVYEDSDGVEFESPLSPLASLLSTEIDGNNGVLITVTAPVNPYATKFGIYRSIDEASAAVEGGSGGGYPFLYRIGEQLVADGLVYTDDFSIPPDTIPDKPILFVFTVLYPDGTSATMEANNPPPKAKLAMPFQGVMCYVPSEVGQGHYLYYSLASTISVRGIEQVPAFQYLDFQSPRNDTITTAITTNGGKSLLVFFSNYAMLVNYLPQASDGVFDNRIKEYVSNNRGSAGRLTSCEFTLSAGQTLVASVDALGLWTTNGINQMDEWSRDLNWKVDMAGVNLTTAELIDNTAKRRLELHYELNGARKERHFFYGRLKEDGDGKQSPCMTGPHPSGCRVKHYTQINSAWVGFGGDNSATGDVFLEEGSDADESHGYDSTGIIPTSFALADQYVGGISKAQIIESVTSRWGLTPSKTMTLEVRLTRDTGHTTTKTKTITATPGTNAYVHAYGDRARCRYRDLTNTAMPEFIGQEIDVRDGGPSRDA